MATIANLAVSLTARTGKFNKGLGKARMGLKNFAGGVIGVTAKVAKFTAGLAAVSAAGLTLLIKSQLKSIDSTSKLADVLGLTTEQLVGYQQAAKISGVENSQLNTGLQRMLKTISDAERGLSTASDSLDMLGLNATELKKLSTDQIFKLISDQLRGVPSQVDKAAIALNVFGRSGLGIVKIAEQGSEGIQRFQEETVRLGLAFNRVDGAKVELANDSLSRMFDLLKGVGVTLAIKLAPFIQAAADKIIELGTEGGNAGIKVSKAFESVALAIAQAADFLNVFPAALNSLQSITAKVVARIVQAFNFLLKQVTKIGEFFESFVPEFAAKSRDAVLRKFGLPTPKDFLALHTESSRFLTQFEKDLDALSAEKASNLLENIANFENGTLQKRVKSFFAEINSSAAKAAEAASKPVAKMEELSAEAVKAAREQQSLFRKMQSRAEQLTKSLRTPLEVFADSLKEIKKLFAQDLITSDTFQRAIERARKTVQQSLGLDQKTEETIFKPGNFRTVDLSSISFERVGETVTKKQTVEDKSLNEKMAELLQIQRQILQGGGGGGLVA